MNNLSLFSTCGNFTFGNAVLAEGTNATTIKTTAAVDYMINGLMYSKAATDNIAFTATASQADLTTCLYLVTINAAGTVTVTKGEEVTTATAQFVPWPTVPSDSAVLGAIKVATSGAVFVGGTTDLGAGTVTDTYYNLCTIPAYTLSV